MSFLKDIFGSFARNILCRWDNRHRPYYRTIHQARKRDDPAVLDQFLAGIDVTLLSSWVRDRDYEQARSRPNRNRCYVLDGLRDAALRVWLHRATATRVARRPGPGAPPPAVGRRGADRLGWSLGSPGAIISNRILHIWRSEEGGRLIDDMTALSAWTNFYVIVGSAAGALDRIAVRRDDLDRQHATHPGYCACRQRLHDADRRSSGCRAVAVSGCMRSLERDRHVAALWGLVGLIGGAYVVLVGRRLRSQTTYQIVFEDRLFHVLLPLTAYAVLAVSACAAFSHPAPALFLAGTAVLLLLFISIHNAWDIITYHVFVKGPEQKEAERHQ